MQENNTVRNLNRSDAWDTRHHECRTAGETETRQFNPIISLSTVKTYLARAYEKYAAVGRPVGNTTAAATQTWEDGWFDLDGTTESH